MAVVGTPVSGPLAKIRRAFERLNPCGDLDVDLLAVTRAAACSSSADWLAQTRSNVSVDGLTGLVTLAETVPTTVFSQTAGSSVQHFFHDAQDGAEEVALDFFPTASAFSGVPFALDSLDVELGLNNSVLTFLGKAQFFRVTVGIYDARWRLVQLGDPIDINTRDIAAQMGALSGVYSIRFRQDYNRRIVFEPGTIATHTGPGRDSSGLLRVVVQDASGASTVVLARGLSIGITPMGPGFQYAWIGCCPTATLPAFDPTAFWRTATNRNMGPYDPETVGYAALDTGHNPDDHLTTGAVPGYGALAVTNGQWGMARRILTAQRAQDATNGWQQPYHVLRAVAYQASGTVTAVLDLGGVPTNPVQLRLNDVQPAGTSIAYTLSGSNTAASGPWTGLGAVVDGQELTNATGTYLYRWYQLTATLTAGGGATKFSTPGVLAWQMVERITLSTWRYLKDFDADATVDPVTGQSSVAELKLPMLRAGVRTFRDLATMVNSQYAPASIEAHVFARDTIGGTRLFLNSYRLENRNPQDGAEEMTFVGGLDLLSGLLPPSRESYRYPAAAGTQGTITSVTGTAPAITIGVSGTPFVTQNLSGFRYHGVTGASAKLDYTITSSGSGNFLINTQTAGAGQYGVTPAVGDTFEIHSDATTRGPLTYSGQDFAAIASDLLTVQSGVPARYRGQLPATTGRLSGTYTLPAEGVKGLDVLSHIGLHCGGAWQWSKGRIAFFDVYGRKDSVLTLDERQYTTLDTPLGADRRMPSVKAKYGYQPDTQQFANELQTDDADTLAGWGRANLFDVFELPDDVAKWNDAAGTEAGYLTALYQQAWKSGVRLWTVQTVFQYPWLEFGDAVTLVTDQYTDRRLAFASDGVTDIGSPIAGRIAAVGVIVGKNLWGDKLIVAVRGLDAITSLASNATGTVPGTTTVPAMPSPSASCDGGGQAIVNVTGDLATASIKYLVRTDRAPTAAEVRATGATAGNNLVNVASGVTVGVGGTAWVGALAYNAAGDESPLGGASFVRGNIAAPSQQIIPSLTNTQLDDTTVTPTINASATNLPATYSWAIRRGYSKGQYTATPVYSGSNASNPLPFAQNVTPRAKLSDWYQLTITIGADTYTAETQIQGMLTLVTPSGNPQRGYAYDDGYNAAVSSTADGKALPGGVVYDGGTGQFVTSGYFRGYHTADNVANGASTRTVTNNEGTGAGRAFGALDSNNRIVGQTALPMTRTGNVGSSQGGVNPISSVTWNSGAGQWQANISSHSLYHGASGSSFYNSGSVLLPSLNTAYYIYADDPTYAGGAVTYVPVAANSPSTIVAIEGRYFVGSATSGSTGGTGSGTSTTGGGMGGACFAGDTQITMGNGAERRIDTIRAGMMITAFDPSTDRVGVQRVTAVLVHDVAQLRHVQTERGHVTTTPEHPFYRGDGVFVRAGDLRSGDGVMRLGHQGELAPDRVLWVSDEARPVRVYNLTVEDWHTYVAGGFAVHNVKMQ